MTRPTVLHATAGLAAVIAASPLVYLVVRTSGADPSLVAQILLRPRTLDLLAASLGLAVSVAGTCMVAGIGLAWLATRAQIPGGRWWLVGLAAPLAIPSYVLAYTWLSALPGLSGFAASWAVMTMACLPYVVLPVAAVLSRIDPAYDEVARTLGHSRWQALYRTTVPLAWPAATAGGLLVALYTLSEFGVVSLMRFETFTRVIYTSYRAAFDRTTAAVLALVLVGLALLVVLVERRIRSRHRLWRIGSGTARRAQKVPLGPWRWPALALLATVVTLSVGVPTVMLGLMLARSQTDRFDMAELITATGNTATAAGIGALIACCLAIPIAVLAARHRDRLARATETTAFVGHALPGVVVGLSLVFVGLALFPQFYQTLVMLGFAYAVLFLSNAIGAVRSATEQVPTGLEDVARTLGRSRFAAWRSVTARLSLPGLAAGALLVLVTAMKELPATLMLRPTGFETLATQMWQQTSIASFGQAAPYAAGLVLLAAIPALLLARLTQKESA